MAFLEQLGNLADFVGGIAVIVTLIFLTNQVRQSNAAMRTASRETIYAGYRAQNSYLINPETSEAFAVGLREFPRMPSSEKRIFTHVINDHALFFQSAFALYEAGTHPDILDLGFFALDRAGVESSGTEKPA